MADEKQTTDDANASARKDGQKAAEQIAAAKATEDARKQDADTNKAQSESVPYPSQEEADAIKAAAATGAAPYMTRDLKA